MVCGDARWNDLKIADLGDSLRTLMRLDVADHDIHAPFLETVPLPEHRIGLSHAGTGTEVDLQFPKFLPADDGQEIIRAWTRYGGFVIHRSPDYEAVPLRVLGFLFFRLIGLSKT